jgi:uncharacterized protein YggU (UPF0235/DUF167 family)
MKIFVKAKPKAKEEKVEPPIPKLLPTENNEKEWFKVWVKEPAMQGRANAAIAKALANYFKVSNSQVRLISGFSSKQKTFEISI